MKKIVWIAATVGMLLSACNTQTPVQTTSPIEQPPISIEPALPIIPTPTPVPTPVQNPYAGFATRGPAFFETMPVTGKTAWENKSCDQLGIREQMKAMDFNASLQVVASYRGKLQLYCSFGYADPATNLPATIQNTYGIDSVSKLITRYLVLQAVEENKLNLNDPLNTVIAYFKPNLGTFNQPTVLDALRHRIGYGADTEATRYINNYMPFASMPYGTKTGYDGDQNSVEGQIWYYNTVPLTYNPGTQNVYSNAGYVILSAALEQVYNKSYMQILQEKFMSKLGITRIWNDGDTQIIPDRVWRYKDNGEQRTDRNTPAATGASGLVASPLSILKLVEAFDYYEGGKNSPIITTSAYTNYINSYSNELHIGGTKWYGHGGTHGIGSMSLAVSNPDGLSVFITGNTGIAPGKPDFMKIADLISQFSFSQTDLWPQVAGNY